MIFQGNEAQVSTQYNGEMLILSYSYPDRYYHIWHPMKFTRDSHVHIPPLIFCYSPPLSKFDFFFTFLVSSGNNLH